MGIYTVTRDSKSSSNNTVQGNTFNALPENIREVSPSEFWYNMQSQVPRKIEYRAPFLTSEDAPHGYFWGDLVMFYFDDFSGYAYTVNWDPGRSPNGPNDFWPRFFWFGPCYHAWKELSPQEAKEKGQAHYGMCYHVFECVKGCGNFLSYDSSD